MTDWLTRSRTDWPDWLTNSFLTSLPSFIPSFLTDWLICRKFGFEQSFWGTLGDAFLHCSLHWGHTRQTEKQRDDWFNVFWFITEELKTGSVYRKKYFTNDLYRRSCLYLFYKFIYLSPTWIIKTKINLYDFILSLFFQLLNVDEVVFFSKYVIN